MEKKLKLLCWLDILKRWDGKRTGEKLGFWNFAKDLGNGGAVQVVEFIPAIETSLIKFLKVGLDSLISEYNFLSLHLQSEFLLLLLLFPVSLLLND